MSVQRSFSPKEEKAIQELEMRMKHCLTPALCEDESLYYRFLKARDFDVDKAEKMLRKHIIWRRVNQTDTMYEDFKPMEVFCKCAEANFIGYDKKGNIVAYTPPGDVDPVEIVKCMKMSDYIKHWIWLFEKAIAMAKGEAVKTGRNDYRGSVAIVNMDKLPFSKVTCRVAIDMLLRMINMYQNNYPERLVSAYVINALPYFVLFFSVIKQIMSGALIRKIQIFGYSGWKEELLKAIDADVLPAFLGGNRTDPDGNPMCRSFIFHGGRIPKFYFVSEKDRCFKDGTEVKKVIVQPSDKERIHVELNEVGSLLLWEFMVKGKDIGFGIFYEDSENKMSDVIPIEKYGTLDGIEKNSYKCRTTGRYTIVFDNSYSWMSSKEVQYCITVMKPNL